MMASIFVRVFDWPRYCVYEWSDQNLLWSCQKWMESRITVMGNEDFSTNSEID